MAKTPEEVVEGLAQRGVLLLGREQGRFRAVTHYWIGDEDVERTVQAVREVVGGVVPTSYCAAAQILL